MAANGAHASSVAGNTFTDDSLRDLLARALGDDGQFVLANYLRASLGQHGYGHWSVLAAYDRESDRVLILDVAKYKYPPTWVSISALHRAIATTDADQRQAARAGAGLHAQTITPGIQHNQGATMPYVNIRIAGGLSREQKARIAAEITDTLERIAHKPASYTYIVFDEVSDENWAIAGQLLDES